MKLQYFADTDTLAIELVPGPSANTEMVTDSLIIDFDADRNVVGITLEHASKTIDLSSVEIFDLPEAIAPR